MKIVREARYRVFGSATFAGNPVTLFEVDALDDSLALLQAAKQSATNDNVFFVANDHVHARFYSSTAELWLCGHGLLALSQHLHSPDVAAARDVHSTHATWQIYPGSDGPGVLMPAQHAVDVTGTTHWMNEALLDIGIKHERLYRAPNEVWIALLRDMAELQKISAAAVAALPCGDTKPGALIATLRLPHDAYGFRYFAPWHGKEEDSGTGSAHCYLAPLLLAGSHVPVTAWQFSPAGVAEMRVNMRGKSVALAGKVELCG
jgi:predicted PhzF superfamily epimerase YddE/YHI9